MAQPILGLQVYTVRDALGEDFAGTLKRVKEVGYDAVELCGTGPFSGTELKDVLDDIGLRIAGTHTGIDALENDTEACIQLAHDLEMTNLVCSFMPEERRKTGENWAAVARAMDGIGQRLREAGLRLSYHNHSFEFQTFDGQYGLDIFFENCSPENVYSELDTYWVKDGGEDPVAYINKYAGRINILHCKDKSAGEKGTYTEVGNGILDWPAIHAAAVAAGVEWYAVEQDICPGDPFDSAAASARFVRQNLLA